MGGSWRRKQTDSLVTSGRMSKTHLDKEDRAAVWGKQDMQQCGGFDNV